MVAATIPPCGDVVLTEYTQPFNKNDVTYYGSVLTMGIVVLAQKLPMILLLHGGVVADRFPRQQVILLSDASRAVTVLVIDALDMTHLLQL